MFKLLIKNSPKTIAHFETFKNKFHDIEIIFDEINIKTIENVDGVLTWTLSEEEVKSAKKLKVIFAPLTGLNGFPEKLLEDRNIRIYNTHAKSKYIAERGFALLLATMGKVHKTDKIFRNTNMWANRSYDEFWYSLYDKKVAFYGFGHIGNAFFKLIQPFNPTVNTLKRYEGRCDAHNFYEDLETLAENSDILFVSTPLNQETKNSINLNILKKLNGFVINVGRGAIINEEDFYISLKESYIKGAGSDVWYNYPKDNSPTPPSKFPFNELDNIVMSPHTAWSTFENPDIQILDTISNIRKYLDSITK